MLLLDMLQILRKIVQQCHENNVDSGYQGYFYMHNVFTSTGINATLLYENIAPSFFFFSFSLSLKHLMQLTPLPGKYITYNHSQKRFMSQTNIKPSNQPPFQSLLNRQAKYTVNHASSDEEDFEPRSTSRPSSMYSEDSKGSKDSGDLLACSSPHSEEKDSTLTTHTGTKKKGFVVNPDYL